MQQSIQQKQGKPKRKITVEKKKIFAQFKFFYISAFINIKNKYFINETSHNLVHQLIALYNQNFFSAFLTYIIIF